MGCRLRGCGSGQRRRRPYIRLLTPDSHNAALTEQGPDLHAGAGVGRGRDADVGQKRSPTSGRAAWAGGPVLGGVQGGVGADAGIVGFSRARVEPGREIDGQHRRGVGVAAAMRRALAPLGGPLSPKPSNASMRDRAPRKCDGLNGDGGDRTEPQGGERLQLVGGGAA